MFGGSCYVSGHFEYSVIIHVKVKKLHDITEWQWSHSSSMVTADAVVAHFPSRTDPVVMNTKAFDHRLNHQYKNVDLWFEFIGAITSNLETFFCIQNCRPRCGVAPHEKDGGATMRSHCLNTEVELASVKLCTYYPCRTRSSQSRPKLRAQQPVLFP